MTSRLDKISLVPEQITIVEGHVAYGEVMKERGISIAGSQVKETRP